MVVSCRGREDSVACKTPSPTRKPNEPQKDRTRQREQSRKVGRSKSRGSGSSESKSSRPSIRIRQRRSKTGSSVSGQSKSSNEAASAAGRSSRLSARSRRYLWQEAVKNPRSHAFLKPPAPNHHYMKRAWVIEQPGDEPGIRIPIAPKHDDSHESWRASLPLSKKLFFETRTHRSKEREQAIKLQTLLKQSSGRNINQTRVRKVVTRKSNPIPNQLGRTNPSNHNDKPLRSCLKTNESRNFGGDLGTVARVRFLSPQNAGGTIETPHVPEPEPSVQRSVTTDRDKRSETKRSTDGRFGNTVEQSSCKFGEKFGSGYSNESFNEATNQSSIGDIGLSGGMFRRVDMSKIRQTLPTWKTNDTSPMNERLDLASSHAFGMNETKVVLSAPVIEYPMMQGIIRSGVPDVKPMNKRILESSEDLDKSNPPVTASVSLPETSDGREHSTVTDAVDDDMTNDRIKLTSRIDSKIYRNRRLELKQLIDNTNTQPKDTNKEKKKRTTTSKQNLRKVDYFDWKTNSARYIPPKKWQKTYQVGKHRSVTREKSIDSYRTPIGSHSLQFNPVRENISKKVPTISYNPRSTRSERDNARWTSNSEGELNVTLMDSAECAVLHSTNKDSVSKSSKGSYSKSTNRNSPTKIPTKDPMTKCFSSELRKKPNKDSPVKPIDVLGKLNNQDTSIKRSPIKLITSRTFDKRSSNKTLNRQANLSNDTFVRSPIFDDNKFRRKFGDRDRQMEVQTHRNMINKSVSKSHIITANKLGYKKPTQSNKDMFKGKETRNRRSATKSSFFSDTLSGRTQSSERKTPKAKRKTSEKPKTLSRDRRRLPKNTTQRNASKQTGAKSFTKTKRLQSNRQTKESSNNKRNQVYNNTEVSESQSKIIPQIINQCIKISKRSKQNQTKTNKKVCTSRRENKVLSDVQVDKRKVKPQNDSAQNMCIPDENDTKSNSSLPKRQSQGDREGVSYISFNKHSNLDGKTESRNPIRVEQKSNKHSKSIIVNAVNEHRESVDFSTHPSDWNAENKPTRVPSPKQSYTKKEIPEEELLKDEWRTAPKESSIYDAKTCEKMRLLREARSSDWDIDLDITDSKLLEYMDHTSYYETDTESDDNMRQFTTTYDSSNKGSPSHSLSRAFAIRRTSTIDSMPSIRGTIKQRPRRKFSPSKSIKQMGTKLPTKSRASSMKRSATDRSNDQNQLNRLDYATAKSSATTKSAVTYKSITTANTKSIYQSSAPQKKDDSAKENASLTKETGKNTASKDEDTTKGRPSCSHDQSINQTHSKTELQPTTKALDNTDQQCMPQVTLRTTSMFEVPAMPTVAKKNLTSKSDSENKPDFKVTVLFSKTSVSEEQRRSEANQRRMQLLSDSWNSEANRKYSSVLTDSRNYHPLLDPLTGQYRTPNNTALRAEEREYSKKVNVLKKIRSTRETPKTDESRSIDKSKLSTKEDIRKSGSLRTPWT